MVPKQPTPARVLAGQPCKRRTTWLIVLPACGHCGNVHSFRVREVAKLFDNEITRSCPVSGKGLSLEVSL